MTMALKLMQAKHIACALSCQASPYRHARIDEGMAGLHLQAHHTPSQMVETLHEPSSCNHPGVEASQLQALSGPTTYHGTLLILYW